MVVLGSWILRLILKNVTYYYRIATSNCIKDKNILLLSCIHINLFFSIIHSKKLIPNQLLHSTGQVQIRTSKYDMDRHLSTRMTIRSYSSFFLLLSCPWPLLLEAACTATPPAIAPTKAIPPTRNGIRPPLSSLSCSQLFSWSKISSCSS